jgi:hypothetical protein
MEKDHTLDYLAAASLQKNYAPNPLGIGNNIIGFGMPYHQENLLSKIMPSFNYTSDYSSKKNDYAPKLSGIESYLSMDATKQNFKYIPPSASYR